MWDGGMASAGLQRRQLHHVVEQVRDLQQHRSDGLQSAMQRIVDTAVESVPGVQWGGMTLVDTSGGVETIGATHECVTTLDDIQRRHREGPCLSDVWHHHTIRVDDMSVEDRWPRYRADALALTPVRSIVSYRLFAASDAVGVLNLYGAATHTFDGDAAELGGVFASHAAVAWNVFRRDEQFRSALASRDLIGQAKGMLMERFSIDAVAAFDLLKRLSQESNTKLVDIAERLVLEHGRAAHAEEHEPHATSPPR